MKIVVITKKNVITAAAVLIALVVAVIIALALSNGGEKAEPTSADAALAELENARRGENDSAFKNSSIEEYETEVMAALRKELPVYSVERDDKKIALTIDAAWDDDKTPFILQTLDRYGIKATFFLCGSWVKAYPEKVKKIYDAGHSIGNHSLTHPHMSKLSASQIEKEIRELDDLIERITGERTTLFRAPYGEYNDQVILTVRASGHEPIQWDIDTIDWKPERSSQTILDSVLSKLDDGSIILCHNNGYKIEEYLPTLIETAQANGYCFVTVDELLLSGDTMIDVNGVQKLK